MRIDREEKKSLKKLLAGILVMALVLTMMPISGMGAFEAKAESLKKGILANATTFVVATAEEFYDALEGIDANGNQIGVSSDGIIIQLAGNIDFEGGGISLPSFPVGIEMRDYEITGLGYLDYVGEASLDLIEGYRYNLIVQGTKKNKFAFYPQKSEMGDESTQTRTYIIDGMQVIFSNVDVQEVLITAEAGSAFGYNDFFYEVPIPTEDVEQTQLVYDSKMGIGIYRSGKSGGDMPTVYVDELHFKEGITEFNVTNALDSYTTYVYTEEVVSSIPSNVKLIYENYVSKETYDVPDQEFIVDNDYGMYAVDGDNLYIYALGNTIDTKEIDCTTEGDTEHSGEADDPIPVRINIYNPYQKEDEYGMSTGELFKNVFFVEGFLPDVYSELVWGDYPDPVNTYFQIKQIRFAESYMAGQEEVEYVFDMTNHPDIEIWNLTNMGVSIEDEDSNANSIVWVPFDISSMERYPEDGEPYTICDIQNLTFGEDKEDGRICAKAGEIITLSAENQTIYNIQLGSRNVGDNEDGRRADLDHITFATDGTVKIKIPNYDSALDVTVGDIPTVVPSDYLIISTDSTTYEGVEGFFDKEFKVTAIENYDICNASDLASGWITGGITVDSEGQETIGFYLLDKRLTTDGTPVDTYGQRLYVEYPYALDFEAPVITSVTAKDSMGNTLELKGGWQADSAETVWTNQPTIGLTVTANQGGGLPVAGYKFDYGEDAGWQTGNTYAISGEGKYDLEIHARDEFDVKMESAMQPARAEAGIWKTSIGIDLTAPTLLFTDAQNPTRKVLESNLRYEGNLHLVCDDGEGSGLKEINLYKKSGEEWVASDDLLIATEDGSYIAPDTKDRSFRIEVVDIAGNKTVYDNITISGYEQDVEIEVDEESGTYGEDFEIKVTVTNISDNDLEISLFGLREDETDKEFGKEIDSETELAAGEKFTTTLELPKGTDADTYEAMIDMKYTNMGGDASQHIAKVYSYQIKASIKKAEGTGSVTMDDFYYGETKEPSVASDTNGAEDVVIYYKASGAEDSTYTTTVPSTVGNYVAKAVFAATKNYKEVEVTDEFAITRLQADATMYSVSQPTGENGVYTEPVVIRGLDGNLISTSEIVAFTDRIVLNESIEFFRFFVKTPSGAISDPVILRDIVVEIEQEPTMVTEGSVHLNAGEPYEFGSGTWKVSGDSTSYEGGNTFYVPQSGDYEFTQN